MSKIGHVLLCEEVLVDEDGRKFLMNPIVSFVETTLPKKTNFHISIGIYDIVSHTFNVIISILDPNDTLIIIPKSIGVKFRSENKTRSGIVNIECKDIEFNITGEYTIKVDLVDDSNKLNDSNELKIPVYNTLLSIGE